MKLNTISATFIISFASFLVGLVSVLFFYAKYYFPIEISIIAIISVSIIVFLLYWYKQIGWLQLILYVTFIMPFLNCLGYAGYDFDQGNTEALRSFWPYWAIEPMKDKLTIKLMIMIGATGATAFLFGTVVAGMRRSRATMNQVNFSGGRSLSLPLTAIVLSVALILSGLVAPKDTIFTAAYTESTSALKGANFGSAWMIAACFILFSWIDTLVEARVKIRKIKLWMTLIVAGKIILVDNLLRGDREAVTLAFAMIIVWLLIKRPFVDKQLKTANIIFIILAGSLVYLSGQIIGQVRSQGVGTNFLSLVWGLFEEGKINLALLFNGTWSAVLGTPLSIASDYVNGIIEPAQFGKSYIDVVLSIPPGFLADLVGYVRPLSDQDNLAWKMTYGIGGIHAVVMPFYDFRMPGVFLVIALWSYFTARIDGSCLSFQSILLRGCMIIAAPWWLWYGEKAIINAVIICYILVFVWRAFARRHGAPVPTDSSIVRMGLM